MSDKINKLEEDLKKAEAQGNSIRMKIKNIKAQLDKVKADELVEVAITSGLTLEEAKEVLRAGVKSAQTSYETVSEERV